MSRRSQNPPKRHHYVPQFFLRNFAIDDERKKVMALTKHGQRAVWSKKSIKSIAFENDLYVHLEGKTPVSVETRINNDLETPISMSETWEKISCGALAELDREDRGILYSLVRHFEARTPHYRNAARELSILAAQPDSGMNFSDEEKEMYAAMRADPALIAELDNMRASSLWWTEREFASCGISIWRVSEPVYVCTTPVLTMPVTNHPRLRATQAGLAPYSLLMPLAPYAYACVSLGDFDGEFTNQAVGTDVEFGLKRRITAQFSYWPIIRHMIADGDALTDHLKWAGYNCVNDGPKKKAYQRDKTFSVHNEVL